MQDCVLLSIEEYEQLKAESEDARQLIKSAAYDLDEVFTKLLSSPNYSKLVPVLFRVLSKLNGGI